MKRRTLVVEIAIGALVLALGVWLAVDTTDAPAPIVVPSPSIAVATPAPAPVAAPSLVVAPPSQSTPVLSVRGHSVLCVDDRCRLISGGTYIGPRTYHAQPISTGATAKIAGCSLTVSGMLTCDHDAPVHVDVTMAGGIGYLRAGDRLASVNWLSWDDERPGAPSPLQWLPAFPDGIVQVAGGLPHRLRPVAEPRRVVSVRGREPAQDRGSRHGRRDFGHRSVRRVFTDRAGRRWCSLGRPSRRCGMRWVDQDTRRVRHPERRGPHQRTGSNRSR